ncbi:MAG: Integral membrane protein, partial [uncultured Gemmatimonadaceae bacterium]
MPTPTPFRRLTTATTHDPLGALGERWLPPALLAAYALLWTAAALRPASREGWLLENVLPLSILGLLGGMYRRWHLSDASYLCVAVFLALHAAGAHYGYADVPVAPWLRAWLGGPGGRNPYDRLVHLAFGLCWFYPTREALLYNVSRRGTATVFSVAAVLAAGAVYEVLEWGAALLVAPATAASFVGAQGDPWDAQQDMAFAALGALLAAALTAALARV